MKKCNNQYKRILSIGQKGILLLLCIICVGMQIEISVYAEEAKRDNTESRKEMTVETEKEAEIEKEAGTEKEVGIEAEIEKEPEGEMLQGLELIDIDAKMKTLFPENTIKFSELVTDLMHGDKKLNVELIIGIIKVSMLGDIGEIQKITISILVIGVVAALFSNVSHMFENHQIADISFYFLYMLLMLILLITFKNTLEVAGETMENMVLFMKLLIPTFFAIVSLSSASLSAAAFSELMLGIIVIVESILTTALLPAVNGYVFLSMINGLSEEERLAPLAELLKKGIGTALKVIIGCIGGLGFFQSMITPVIDSVKTLTVQKTIAAIPGIGGAADSVAEVVLGSAILIKNSVGIAFVILLIGCCAMPIFRIAIVAIMLKLSAALIGVVTDKRMMICTNQVGDGAVLLLKIVMTTIALFVITIAIVISATNRGY